MWQDFKKTSRNVLESFLTEFLRAVKGLMLCWDDVSSFFIQSLFYVLDKAEADTESDFRSDQGAESSDFTLGEKYMERMKEEQFDTFEIVQEDEGIIRFTMSHHYESNIKTAGDINNPARARRLAQEAVTLSTSLPLSASSSVFVRCDEDRLDVMKVGLFLYEIFT